MKKNGVPCVCEALKGTVRLRYEQKIAKIGGICPWDLERKTCSTETKDFPPVSLWSLGMYLVNEKSAFTAKQFQAYKSLNAYNMFYCGWVQDIYCITVGSHKVVVGAVSVCFFSHHH